jgi:hypothetical protein
MTIGHARDWLSVHAGAPEVIDGLKSFRKKGEMPYAKIRERAAAPAASKFGPGVDLNPCNACNAPMPTDFAFCGACGQKR